MSQTKVEIINYSERSFAVVGESTKVLKEDLKKFGGRYNPHLSCGAGWIFPVKAYDSVTSFLEKKGLKVVKKDLSDTSSSSDEETKDPKVKATNAKDAKHSKTKASKDVKVTQPSKPKVITPKDAKVPQPVKASQPLKKVVLSDSDSDSEEEQTRPVKATKASKASQASNQSDSDSSDDEKVVPCVSYEDHARVTRELESAKEEIRHLQEKLSKLQIRFIDCEEGKNIAVQKYKTLKAKVKQSKKKCESVATSTEPGSVESQEEDQRHEVRERHEDEPTQESRGRACVAM
jgi:hypothetical protein